VHLRRHALTFKRERLLWRCGSCRSALSRNSAFRSSDSPNLYLASCLAFLRFDPLSTRQLTIANTPASLYSDASAPFPSPIYASLIQRLFIFSSQAFQACRTLRVQSHTPLAPPSPLALMSAPCSLTFRHSQVAHIAPLVISPDLGAWRHNTRRRIGREGRV
jgi:hypothetical protein